MTGLDGKAGRGHGSGSRSSWKDFLCLMFKLGNVETGTNQPRSRHPSGSVTKVDGGLQSAFVEPLPIKVNLTV